MSPPDDFNFKLLDWAWAGILALGGLVWRGQGDKIAGLGTEIDRQRDNIAKIFDKLEKNSERAEDRHREILGALHEGLDRKADK